MAFGCSESSITFFRCAAICLGVTPLRSDPAHMNSKNKRLCVRSYFHVLLMLRGAIVLVLVRENPAHPAEVIGGGLSYVLQQPDEIIASRRVRIQPTKNGFSFP